MGMMTFEKLDDSTVDVILKLLSDRNCRQVLKSVIDGPKTAHQIGLESGMLLSTVYRKLRYLQNRHLLDCKCQLREDGKKILLYRSRIRLVSARFGADLLDVTVEPNMALPSLRIK